MIEGGSKAINQLRLEVLKLLGSKCSDVGCTWSHPDVLQIDHINPVMGYREPSWKMLLRIKHMEHPEHEFQLLCANHHRLKTVRDLEDICEYKSSLRQLDTLGV